MNAARALRERLILSAMPAAKRLASRYTRSRLGREDALAVGYLAIVEGYRRFDPSRGVPFAGYVYRRVKGAMSDAQAALSDEPWDTDKIARQPDERVTDSDAKMDVERVMRTLSARNLTIFAAVCLLGYRQRDIAKVVGVSEQRVFQILKSCRRKVGESFS